MPAAITPMFTITSVDVKIMLACMWASLLFDFCSKYREVAFPREPEEKSQSSFENPHIP